MKLSSGVEPGVHQVDVALQPLDLRADDPQRSVDLAGRRDVRAKIEQVVLDFAAAGRRSAPSSSSAIAIPIAALASSTSPIAVIRKLDLLTRLPSTSPARAAVARSRVDLVELDQA